LPSRNASTTTSNATSRSRSAAIATTYRRGFRAAAGTSKDRADLGAAYVRPYLLGAGITSEMLGLIEQELNAEGYSLGPLSKQNSPSVRHWPLSLKKSK